MFILPMRLHAKLPMSRFKDERECDLFILQKRRRTFRSPKSHLYRIVTRDKTDGMRTKIAVGNDLQTMMDKEWRYITEELGALVPAHLGGTPRVLWLLAHFTQKALDEMPRGELDVFDDDDMDMLAGGPGSPRAVAASGSVEKRLQHSSTAAALRSRDARTGRDEPPRRHHHKRASSEFSGVSAVAAAGAPPELKADGDEEDDEGDEEDEEDGREAAAPPPRHRSNYSRAANDLLDIAGSAPEAVRHGASPLPFAAAPPAPAAAVHRPRVVRRGKGGEAGGEPPAPVYVYRPHPGQLLYDRAVALHGWRVHAAALAFLNLVVLTHGPVALLVWLNLVGGAAVYGAHAVRRELAAAARAAARPPSAPVLRAGPAKARRRSGKAAAAAAAAAPPLHEAPVAGAPARAGAGAAKRRPRPEKERQPDDDARPLSVSGTLPRAAAGDEGERQRHCYTEREADTFNVRVGPDYASNKKKAPSAASLCELVGVDVYRSDSKCAHIGRAVRVPRMRARRRRELGMPEHIIVNMMVPDYSPPVFGRKEDGKGWALVFYYRLRPETVAELRRPDAEMAPGARLLRDFVMADPSSELRGRFKGICRLTNIADKELALSSVTKRLVTSYNGTPFLIRTSPTFYRRHDYFEVSVDVHRFSSAALFGLNSIKGITALAEFDLGFVVQGESDGELPEVMLGAAHIRKLDLPALRQLSDLGAELPPVDEHDPGSGTDRSELDDDSEEEKEGGEEEEEEEEEEEGEKEDAAEEKAGKAVGGGGEEAKKEAAAEAEERPAAVPRLELGGAGLRQRK